VVFQQYLGRDPVVPLWEEYGDIASKIGCTVAGGVAAAISQNPESALKTVQQCLQTKDKIEQAIRSAEENYRAAIGRTSSLTIGPRLLRLDRWERGTIVSSAERLFVTAAPMFTDKPTLRIREIGGKGKVSVTVCAYKLANGGKKKCRKLLDFLVNEDRGEKRDRGQSFNLRLSGVEDEWISVHLDGKSVANTFKYKLMLDT
jgi:hypothetical protein